MDNLEEILSSLPKHRISWLADKKIKLRLWRLILRKKLGSLFISENFYSMSTSSRLAAVALGVIAIFSMTSIYAYADSRIVPGNQLYPLKKAVEKIEEKIAITPSAKIAAYEKFSNRRLQEAVNLSEQKIQATENIKKNIDEEVKNNEAVTNSINKLDEKKVEKAVSRIKKQDQSELQSLEKIEARAAAKNDQEIVEKVKEAKEKIKKREYKQNKGNKKDEEHYEDVNNRSSELITNNDEDGEVSDNKSKKGKNKDDKQLD